jgi:hypothetical protein
VAFTKYYILSPFFKGLFHVLFVVNDLLKMNFFIKPNLDLCHQKSYAMLKSFFSALSVFILSIGSPFAQIIVGPAIEVNKEIHDYGMVEYGANGTCEFVITNIGTEPLVIQSAKSSCGCTVPSYPKYPIAPGASATITVKYDTKRPGSINKSIKITSNAVNASEKVIYIKGQVQQQADYPAQTGSTSAPANNGQISTANGRG